MKLFYAHLKCEELKDQPAGGAPIVEVTKTPEATPPASPQSATPLEKTGGNLDDFGYEKPKASVKPGEENKGDIKETKKPDTPPPEEKIEAVTGYDKDIKPIEEEKPLEVPVEDPNKLEYELDVKDLDTKQVEKIKIFAKKNNLSKEQAQAFSEMTKAEQVAFKQSVDDYNKKVETERTNTKAAWQTELKNDPEFGGANYKQNVDKTNKFVGEFMPETKKVLTERGSMLPPSVMRDISKLADKVYASSSFVSGGGPTGQGAPAEKKEEHKPWNFYN